MWVDAQSKPALRGGEAFMIVRIAQYPAMEKQRRYCLRSKLLTVIAHGRLTFLLISALLPCITVLFSAFSGLCSW